MISKTKINKRTERKTDPKIVETIKLAKKNGLLDLAKKLSGSTRLQSKINVGDLKDEKVLVVGRVLGSGEINKKISIGALSFSEQACEKLKKAGCEILSVKQMIEKNEKLEGVKII